MPRPRQALIVAEAWDAHLPFHPDLLTWPCTREPTASLTSTKWARAWNRLRLPCPGRAGGPFAVVGMSRFADDGQPERNDLRGGGRLAPPHGAARPDLSGGRTGNAQDLRGRVEAVAGLHVLHDELIHAEASLPSCVAGLIDVSELAISGSQAADWLRARCRIVGLRDHRRILATLSFADDQATTAGLVSALKELLMAAPGLPRPGLLARPDPSGLQLQTVDRPRDANR